MKFSYNLLQDFVRGKLPKPEKLAELLTMHSFEVSEVRKWGKDWVLDIDVLPNRMPDCASHMGIARECAAILRSKLKIPNSQQTQNSKLKTQNFITVEVQDRNDCRRYTAKVVTNVKIGSSPKWMQERLEACGLQTINNVVDAVNYVMLETGQPLHAFDFDKIESETSNSPKNIIVRRAVRGESITTLDGKNYELDQDILVIADQKEPLVIAGIKGGKKAEVDTNTKTIVLESANFQPFVVRFGSKKLGIKTDASLRFEHGLDPNLTEIALNRAAELISILARGDVAAGTVDFYPKKSLPRKIKVDIAYINRLLGVEISQKELTRLLARLGITSQNWTSRYFIAVVPTFRLDLLLPEDLIEEIARLYEYEKIPAVFPRSALIPPKRNDDIFWEDMARNVLKEAGFTEVYNYSFIGERDAELFGDHYWMHLCEVENPVSSDYKYLRPSLIINLLKNAKFNQNYFPDMKIFELGKVFGADASERRMLTGLLAGDSFYLAKGVIDSLFSAMGVGGMWYDEYEPNPDETPLGWWQTGRSAEIKTEDNRELGYVGEVNRDILEALKIEGKIVIFDIDFEKLQELVSEEHAYRPVSKYPAVLRDIAVLVPHFTRVEEVLNVIETAGGMLVQDVDLFDIYEGEELPEGKKNLAFHIVYQAEDRTLTSKEVDAVHNKIIKSLEENEEWQVRK
jgi:phenylalanyl-tRNA synthetase beta chain